MKRSKGLEERRLSIADYKRLSIQRNTNEEVDKKIYRTLYHRRNYIGQCN